MLATRFSGCFLVLAMAIPFAVRAWLSAEHSADLAGLAPGQWLELFVVGARLDAVTIGWGSLPVLAALLLTPERWRGRIRGSVLGYAFGGIGHNVWFIRSGHQFATNLIDGIVYGVVTGLIFAWLWPALDVAISLPTP